MRILVSGGGTGGHVYPALTVVETLHNPKPAGSTLPALNLTDVLWIGSRDGIEEDMVRRAGVEFIGLAAGGLRGMGWLDRTRNLARIAGSVAAAEKNLAHFRPDVVLVTGGYACVAVTLAARSRRIPVLIYLPDVVPGLAIRFLSRFAARIAVTSEESYHYFGRGKVVVTGYPVRPAIFNLSRDEARQALGLNGDLPTVLVFGGSRGARSINQALVAGLEALLPACQVLHISGSLDAEWVMEAAKSLRPELRPRYHPLAYLHDMPAGLVAADLAVARAGAAALGEFPAAALPAILVPYPYSGQHQQANADYMHGYGAVRVLRDGALRDRLIPDILELLSDKQALADMRQSTRAMARPDAAEAVAEQLWILARRRTAREMGVAP